MATSGDDKPTPPLDLGHYTVTVYSGHLGSSGLLLRDERLDADGRTLSVIGCKSGIPQRKCGDKLLIRLANGILVPATITHIHQQHDRFRAAVAVEHLRRAGVTALHELRTASLAPGASVANVDTHQQISPH